jgi:lysophospholipase L1-like esterase
LIAGLAAELWLRLDRRVSVRASRRYAEGNVFFAQNNELNAADRSLWLKVWQKYRPGARAELTAGEERFVVQINSRGFRTHEFAVPKPAGLVRVVCIGGSTTVAGPTNQTTYPALLETLLRLRHPGLPIEVLNLGVSGVTSEHWRARLARVLAFEPDVIVDYEGINDICWIHLAHYARDHPLRRLAHHSLLLERLFPLPSRELEPYLADTFTTLGAIAEACRARRVGYLLGSFAGPDGRRASEPFRRHLDVNMEYWTTHLPLHSYGAYQAILERYNRLLVEFVQKRHLDHVLVHRQLDDPTLFIDACHFTPDGIRRLAEALQPGVDGLLRDASGYQAWQTQAAQASTRRHAGIIPQALSGAR